MFFFLGFIVGSIITCSIIFTVAIIVFPREKTITKYVEEVRSKTINKHLPRGGFINDRKEESIKKNIEHEIKNN